MVKKLIEPKYEIIQDGGVTFKVTNNKFFIWAPKKDTEFELLIGTLEYAGVVKKRFKHPRNKTIFHERDSFKYFIIVQVEMLNPKSEDQGTLDFFLESKLYNRAYVFENKETENLIEKIIYQYTEGDKVRLLYRHGKYSIDESGREKVCDAPYWGIESQFTGSGPNGLFHEHPITGRKFEVPFLHKGKKYVCPGCGRKAPKSIEMQMKLVNR